MRTPLLLLALAVSASAQEAGKVDALQFNSINLEFRVTDLSGNPVAVGGNVQITLNWNANTESNLAGYYLYRSRDANGPFTKIQPNCTSNGVDRHVLG